MEKAEKSLWSSGYMKPFFVLFEIDNLNFRKNLRKPLDVDNDVFYNTVVLTRNCLYLCLHKNDKF